MVDVVVQPETDAMPQPTADGYLSVRAATEDLAAPLSPEDQTVQSMPDVSPTKWHRAHTTWFFETFVLARYASRYTPYDPRYGYLFNSYYEAVGSRHPRPERGLVTRPGVPEIAVYRRAVDEAMVALLSAGLPDDGRALVELGLHHEQQHQELLLMDIKHVLSCSPVEGAYRRDVRAPSAAGEPRPARWTAHEGGVVEIGHTGDGFAFDNESPRHRVVLEPFLLADHPVTCAEWLAFVDDGGYVRPELWLSDGWATVQTQGWTAPLYWQHDTDGWSVFTLSGRRAVDPGEPVCHVSYYEADAFARWSGARLPTEAEWEVVAREQPVAGNLLDPGGDVHPRPGGGMYGDAWEWTGSAYLPYPGFRPAAGAVGEYNGKFMVNQQVLRGGCCATPRGHVRPTYRNFFPPASRWAFSGLRLARDADRRAA